ncbi:NAD(P)/FAD-dependent oxidoreductase [Marivirga salinae]|uniref:NAD(P)/FAD-dependent oxidoreductase n=1 Tax=Marivirga salinarum TaxID=3059078 RepID=A0AA51NE26_9BACT|nr:NAD(P)/FAD-dependent oxidoreductase [Marivirga sp. BDSF4-3]WMN12236.1 NAD(P)/FAD-dependent oxidoreductase [Marivirga sp. BDSF4-3]
MIIIIGAGLSGLVTAYKLKQAKIPFKIVEVKNKIGGRIFTKTTENETTIEMGATWFGRQHQNLIRLLNELEIAAFSQFQGEYYYYDDPDSPHHGKYKLPQQEPTYRIKGGSRSLIEKLYGNLEEEDIVFNTRVIEIRKEKEELVVTADNNVEYRANQVILAVPPKIWSHQINFVPALPQELQHTAKNTQTWMEDSIKAAVEFEQPFWRENNSSATIMSNYGPFIECYDHSNQQENKFALCGFLNPAFKEITKEKREKLVLQQLSNILGEQVLKGISYHEYIWSEDDYVKWPKEIFMQPHQNNGHPIFRESFFNNQLIISSSESASTFPGYMDGAVEAGERTFKIITEKTKVN